MNFKMDMRRQMGIDGDGPKLRGDASVKATDKAQKAPKPEPKLEVVKPKVKVATIPEASATDQPNTPSQTPLDDATTTTIATSTTVNSGASSLTSNSDAPKKYIPPHLRKKLAQ
jgi:hypothetical protein